MTVQSAQIFSAHAYEGDPNHVCSDDHPGNHAPCTVCGSGETAYVHSEEAATNGYSLVTPVAATDTAAGTHVESTPAADE